VNNESNQEPERSGGREPGRPERPDKKGKPRSGVNTVMTVLMVVLGVLILFTFFGGDESLLRGDKQITQIEFWNKLYTGNIAKAEQKGDELVGEFKGDPKTRQRFSVEFPPGVLDAKYEEILQILGSKFGDIDSTSFLEMLDSDAIYVVGAYTVADSDQLALFAQFDGADPVDHTAKPAMKIWEIHSKSGEPSTSKVVVDIAKKYPALDIRTISVSNPDAFKAVKPNTFLTQLLITVAPWILIIAIFWFILLRQMRSPGGTGGVLSFGRSRAQLITKEKSNVSFNDVAGIDEAKDEVKEIVEFLKNPSRFSRLGGRIPRGVLLVGPPGTGKTLLAKAIAGEANVPFFSISGSDFVEMFVGVGASRVRDLFRQAREHSPCLVFLDEIDAVGRKRGSGLGGGHDEREQTLNAILVEMDGFDTDEGIILVAATNRPDVLDPALLRPGRFDRQISVGLPDLKGREAILRVHTKNVKVGPGVEMTTLARSTPGFSGAEIASMVNEAALIATLKNKDLVELEDFEEARDKVRWGRQKKSRVMAEKDRRETAYHEGGHALIAHFLPEVEPLHKVTIIPRGMSLGSTMVLPQQDKYNEKKKELLGYIAFAYGGRCAEEIFCDDISTGAYDDIKRATEIARQMVCQWGMSENIGPISYAEASDAVFLGQDLMRSKGHSESMALEIDREIKRILIAAHDRAKKLLMDHKDALEKITEALVKYETLSGEDVATIVDGGDIDEVKRCEAEQERNAEESRRRDRAAKADSPASRTENDGVGEEDLGGAEPHPA